VLKLAYFVTVIDGVYCMHGTCVCTDARRVSIVTFERSELTVGYNTAVTLVIIRG